MIKDTSTYFIGIDYGGTECRIEVYDRIPNKTIFFRKFPSKHYSQYGRDIVSDLIIKYINRTLKSKKLKLKFCAGIGIGISGLRYSKDKIKINQILKKKLKFNNISADSDTIATLNAAHKYDDGAVLICGTGSAMFGRVNGRFYRVGGWGKILGDEGSGYWIGKMILKNLVREFDKEVNPAKRSNLAKLIKKKFNIDEHNILNKIYHRNFPVQKITSVILTGNLKRNKVIRQISEQAVEALIQLIKLFLLKSKARKHLCLVLSGGILENKNIISIVLKRRIKKEFEEINLISPGFSVPRGALMIFINKF